MFMRDDVPCEFSAVYGGLTILERVGKVLDPELDRADPRSELCALAGTALRPCQRRATAADQLVCAGYAYQTATDPHRQHPTLSAD